LGIDFSFCPVVLVKIGVGRGEVGVVVGLGFDPLRNEKNPFLGVGLGEMVAVIVGLGVTFFESNEKRLEVPLFNLLLRMAIAMARTTMPRIKDKTLFILSIDA